MFLFANGHTIVLINEIGKKIKYRNYLLNIYKQKHE
jgi:hypothetical protein